MSGAGVAGLYEARSDTSNEHKYHVGRGQEGRKRNVDSVISSHLNQSLINGGGVQPIAMWSFDVRHPLELTAGGVWGAPTSAPFPLVVPGGY